MFDSGVVQGRFDRSVMGILEFGALVDCCGFVGGDLELLRQWVVLIGKHGGNVFIHGEVASAFFLIPRKVDAGVHFSIQILGNLLVFEESISEVMGMLCAYIFNVKIINYKGEHDGPPLVAPEAGSGFALVVAGET